MNSVQGQSERVKKVGELHTHITTQVDIPLSLGKQLLPIKALTIHLIFMMGERERVCPCVVVGNKQYQIGGGEITTKKMNQPPHP